MIELGGNIQLTGFKELDPGQLIVVKKIVGNFVRKLSDNKVKVNLLSLVLKDVHDQKYELNGKIDIDGRVVQSEVVDFNLFFALNKVLNKLK